MSLSASSSKSPITLNSLPLDVWSWNFIDVAQFLEDNRNLSPSLQKSDIAKIKEQRIDGPTLLESSRPGSTILKDAGIEGQGSVRGVLRIVENLMKIKGISEELSHVPVQYKPTIAEYWCRREVTVKELYDLLHVQSLIQVRGTPSSGKSTLLSLLHSYILQKDPSATVFSVVSWPKLLGGKPSSASELEAELDSHRVAWWLVDEAQMLYGEAGVLLLFKRAALMNAKVVLFCSYGSAQSNRVESDEGYEHPPSPLWISETARVSLRPSNKVQLSLLFSKDEFQDTISLGCDHGRCPNYDLAFRQTLFEWTDGHIGALSAINEIICNRHKHWVRSQLMLTEDDFWKELGGRKAFYDRLSEMSNFGRGLPSRSDLMDPSKAVIFSRLLTKGFINGDQDIDKSALQDCHHRGWIFSESVEQDPATSTRYVLASPLHESFISHRLQPQTISIPFTTVLELATRVVEGFRRSRLSGVVRRIGGTGSEPPLEAHYQNEFYRSMIDTIGGPVMFSPEFSSARGSLGGRIDFFIHGKKWGIVLIRDSDHLKQHHARFEAGGAYGQWSINRDMDDYIMIDFRSTKPQKKHLSMDKLYHVVYDDGGGWKLYNNHLVQVHKAQWVD